VCNLNVLKLYDCLLNVSVHGFMAPSFDWLAACSPVLFECFPSLPAVECGFI